MADNIVTLTDASFGEAIGSDTPVLVDFWAEWCGPCKAIAPVLEDIAGEYPDQITIGKLNIDEHPQSAASHGVMSIPTMIVFQGGEEKKRIVGARPKAAMVSELSEFLG
jgi:thioredoxin 1